MSVYVLQQNRPIDSLGKLKLGGNCFFDVFGMDLLIENPESMCT